MSHVRVLSLLMVLGLACEREAEPIQPPPPPKQAGVEKPSAVEAEPNPSAEPTAEPPHEQPDDGRRIVTFDSDALAGPAGQFEAIIGDWYIGEHDGARGLWVDGTTWRQGTPSATLADQAKKLYGEHYAEFLDNVKAFAFYPVVVWTGEVPSGDIRISCRFYPEAGRIDQAAGIVWSLSSGGKYWGVRANPLEDNILYFDVQRGKRKVHATVRGVATPSHEWHTLEAILAGGEIVVVLDGQERFRQALSEPVTGRVGLWSKADSKVLFDDFTVEPYPLVAGDQATVAGSTGTSG